MNVNSVRLKYANMRLVCHYHLFHATWWRHQMETFSSLLVLCEGNSSVTGGFPSQRQVTRSLDVYFDLRLNKRLRKQSRHRWFETPSRSLWRHCNDPSLPELASGELFRSDLNVLSGVSRYLGRDLFQSFICALFNFLICAQELISSFSSSECPWFLILLPSCR